MSEIEKLKTDEGPAESDLMKLLAKLSFFNYCDEKAFGTEWTDETGCFWDNPRDYLHGHTLGFCCCGDPESADEYLREVLAAINSEYDEQRWKGIERATGADEGQRYFVFYILDKLELATRQEQLVRTGQVLPVETIAARRSEHRSLALQRADSLNDSRT